MIKKVILFAGIFIITNFVSMSAKTINENSILENRTFVLSTNDTIKSPIRKEYTLTFYTTLDEENGWGPINCLGEPLSSGMVANNILPLGTKINLGEYGKVTVKDRGGDNFNVDDRLDFLIVRNENESDNEYKQRVMSYGVKKVIGYIEE